jgi:small subunit ribosomal protein S11
MHTPVVKKNLLNKEKTTMRNFEQTKPSPVSYVCITTTLNNTLINVTDMLGNTLLWASAGSVGFKGSKRSTSYAAQATAERIGQNCLSRNFFRVHVKLRGVGYGKEAALRGLQISGLKITKIEDLTQIPFNGCRPKKRRRL